MARAQGYILAIVFLFVLRESLKKGYGNGGVDMGMGALAFRLMYSTGKEISTGDYVEGGQTGYSHEIMVQGAACNKFELVGPELCAYTDRDRRIELTILMANCHLEKLGAKLMQFTTVKGMAQGTDEEKLLIMDLMEKTPTFCEQMAKLHVKFGFFKSGYTLNVLFDNDEKLKTIIEMSKDSQRERSKTKEVYIKLAKIRRGQKEAMDDMEKIMNAVKVGVKHTAKELQTMLEAYNVFTIQDQLFKETEAETEREMEYIRAQLQSLYSNSGTQHREETLRLELRKYQGLLFICTVVYFFTRSFWGSLIVSGTVMVLGGLISIITLYSGNFSGILYVLYQSNKLLEYTTGINFDIRSYFDAIFGGYNLKIILTNLRMFLIAITSLYAFVQLCKLLFPKIFRSTNGAEILGGGGDDPIPRLPKRGGFDVFNHLEVTAYLKAHQESIEKLKISLEDSVKNIGISIESIPKNPKNATYEHVLAPLPDFQRQEWEAHRMRQVPSGRFSQTSSNRFKVEPKVEYDEDEGRQLSTKKEEDELLPLRAMDGRDGEDSGMDIKAERR